MYKTGKENGTDVFFFGRCSGVPMNRSKVSSYVEQGGDEPTLQESANWKHRNFVIMKLEGKRGK